MRKFFILFFFCCYLSSLLVFSININNCGGHLSATIFGIPINKQCTCNHESEEHTNTCCADQSFSIKFDQSDKYLHANKTISIANRVIDLDRNFLFNYTFVPPLTCKITATAKVDKPPIPEQYLFLLHQSFRI
jgi:hypothetical protein